MSLVYCAGHNVHNYNLNRYVAQKMLCTKLHISTLQNLTLVDNSYVNGDY